MTRTRFIYRSLRGDEISSVAVSGRGQTVFGSYITRKMQKIALLLALMAIAGKIASGSPYRSNIDDDDDIDQIIGGTLARRGSRPYMAFLTVYDIAGGASVCGATILDDSHLLTAAHCLYVWGSLPIMYIEVVMRAYTVLPPEDSAIVRTVSDVANMKIHPSWNATGKLENDIAVLKLDFPIDLTDVYCSPNGDCIGMAQVNVQDASCKESGPEAWAAGWGKTDPDDDGISPELREVKLRVLTADECEETIDYRPPDSQICISQPQGTCRGDSGGPLMVDDVQIGITSFGDYRCSKISVFTRVSYYVDNGWITDNL